MLFSNKLNKKSKGEKNKQVLLIRGVSFWWLMISLVLVL